MNARFTLLELMVVLAVVMVLAALAIPVFQRHVLDARKAELATIVDGMDLANVAYHTAFDVYYTLPAFEPDVLPNKGLRPWSGIAEIGFETDGAVRGSYALARPLDPLCYPTPVSTSSCPDQDYCAAGMTDLDADGNRSCVWRSVAGGLSWINADLH